MKFFSRAKDGGPKSTVTGYWLFELKKLCSVVLLRFDDGTREEYHSHAFNSLSWVLKGNLVERFMHGGEKTHAPGVTPVVTYRGTFHNVESVGTTWVVSFRGPWAKTWLEWSPSKRMFTTLTHGRKEVGSGRSLINGQPL